jgi:hypothetical protein
MAQKRNPGAYVFPASAVYEMNVATSLPVHFSPLDGTIAALASPVLREPVDFEQFRKRGRAV